MRNSRKLNYNCILRSTCWKNYAFMSRNIDWNVISNWASIKFALATKPNCGLGFWINIFSIFFSLEPLVVIKTILQCSIIIPNVEIINCFYRQKKTQEITRYFWIQWFGALQWLAILKLKIKFHWKSSKTLRFFILLTYVQHSFEEIAIYVFIFTE